MIVTHLTSSFMYGGPERQMLGLAETARDKTTHKFLSFAEGGRALHFIREARNRDCDAEILPRDTPYLLDAKRDVIRELIRGRTDVLLCHGYKANLVGRWAARQVGIPAVAVCRGWTGESPRVRLYELFDRCQLRRMDAVVCVSDALAKRIRQTGVPAARIRSIPNAVRPELFRANRTAARERLSNLFRQIPGDSFIIAAAGRLSPEKGYDVLVGAAALVKRDCPGVQFILFGEGRERERLQRLIVERGLSGTFSLAGHREKLDELLPGCDAFVSSSFTEGLPNAVLEAAAMGLPIAATAVGGVPEIVRDGVTGLLVPPRSPELLAAVLKRIVQEPAFARHIGLRAKGHVAERFSFAAQAEGYARLFADLGVGARNFRTPLRRAA